jgi:hypothetical protein
MTLALALVCTGKDSRPPSHANYNSSDHISALIQNTAPPKYGNQRINTFIQNTAVFIPLDHFFDIYHVGWQDIKLA